MSNYEGNASYLYVANVLRGTDTVKGMAPGSIAIVDEAGTVLTGATTSGNARVAQKLASGQVIYSDYFDMATRRNTNGSSYVAPVQQVSYLGFASGATPLAPAAGETYLMNIEWKNTAGEYSTKPLLLSGEYTTSAASQEELVTGLMYSLDGSMNDQPYGWVKMERVAAGAQVATAANAVVVKGSKGVTITGHGLSVGAYVRLAGAMYVVAKVIDVNTIALDSKYKGEDATITAGTDVSTEAGTVAAPTNWGIKFTGVESDNFVPMTDNWKLTRFGLLSGSFPGSSIVTTVNPNEGSGYYKKVANMEAYSQFLDKSPYISAYPRNNEREETLATKGYDFITFDVNDPVVTWVSTGITSSKKLKIQIAMDQALGGDDVDTVFGVTV